MRTDGLKSAALVAGALIVLIGVVLGLSALFGDPPPTVGPNHDKTSCAAEGGTVHEHSQFGGKYSQSTWWCTDGEGNVTGVWFES